MKTVVAVKQLPLIVAILFIQQIYLHMEMCYHLTVQLRETACVPCWSNAQAKTFWHLQPYLVKSHQTLRYVQKYQMQHITRVTVNYCHSTVGKADIIGCVIFHYNNSNWYICWQWSEWPWHLLKSVHVISDHRRSCCRDGAKFNQALEPEHNWKSNWDQTHMFT